MLIVLISFANFGDGDLRIINKAFLCFILCSIFFAAQIHDQPFLSQDLNDLNFKANLMVMLTLFFGIFSSICQDVLLQTLLMSIVVLVNLYFLLSFAKYYLCIQYVTRDENSKINVFIEKLGFHRKQIFKRGFLIIIKDNFKI